MRKSWASSLVELAVVAVFAVGLAFAIQAWWLGWTRAVSCPGNAVCSFPGTITVPKGDHYTMGDNRPDSDDSRFCGPVPRTWLIGYVFCYWPLSRFGTV